MPGLDIKFCERLIYEEMDGSATNVVHEHFRKYLLRHEKDTNSRDLSIQSILVQSPLFRP